MKKLIASFLTVIFLITLLSACNVGNSKTDVINNDNVSTADEEQPDKNSEIKAPKNEIPEIYISKYRENPSSRKTGK